MTPAACRTPLRWALLMGWLVAGASSSGRADETPNVERGRIEFFENRIRPVLVEHCYACHSVDSEEAEGGLLLDSAAGLLGGGDSGPAIESGDPHASLLLAAIRYDGIEMPPEGRLPTNVVADFEKWIADGAVDPRNPESVVDAVDESGEQAELWSFQPVHPLPPPIVASTRPASDVDAYLLDRLNSEGLSRVPAAERDVLARRLHYDLTGLPPTAPEAAEFAADRRPDAMLRRIDRLVAAPGYGVQWGRHWLDVARYADSNGGDFNATFHNAWRYRDYVVDSIARDKPFDEFVREQIAGDLLPAADDDQRTEQVVAAGFLALGAKMLSERDKSKLRMDVVDEQVNTVGVAFLGLTLGCARCHDHKFDPVPTEDYYALAGVFRSTRTLQGEIQQYVSDWVMRDLPATEERIAAVRDHEARAKELAAALKTAKSDVTAAESRLAAARAATQGLVLDEADAKRIGDWKVSTYSPNHLGDGYLHDDQAGKGEKSVAFTIETPKTARYEVRLAYNAGASRAKAVPVTVRHAEGEASISVDQTRSPEIAGLFTALGRFDFAADLSGAVVVSNAGTHGHVIVDAVALVEVDADGQAIASAEASNAVTSAESQLKQAQEAVAELDSQIAAHAEAAPPPLPRAIGVRDEDPAEIGDTAVRIRGDHRNAGDVVPRGVVRSVSFGAASAIPAQSSGRRELADWIADRRNPLTSRVIVNRVWANVFGRGLVASVDNFGALGDRPSHPVLLDRLADDFVAEDWSIKRLVRRLAATATYATGARYDEAAWNLDPENRLRWRANRRRLTAEELRDSLLVAADRLDLSAGRSPVAHLGKLINNNNVGAAEYEQQASYRRSIYLPIVRNELPAILAAFDFADPDFVVGRRPTTNTPAQALFLLNSPLVAETATAAADRIQRAEAQEPATPDGEWIDAVYRAVLARRPSETERARASDFLAAERDAGEASTALARFVHALFASTEFRTLE